MKGLIAKYALPLLIIAVAAHQFYMVYYRSLTRWKGGGFGMYSEIHPIQREVWIGSKDSMWPATNGKITLKDVHTRAKRVRFIPNQKNLSRFAGFAAHKYQADSLLVQVWEPVLTPATHTLTRKLIGEVKYVAKGK